MNMKKLVAVVVPIYTRELSDNDLISLINICDTLGDHPLYAVIPEGLDTCAIEGLFPKLQFVEFAPSYFESIAGYNRLMLDVEFYEVFSSYEYILVAQLDTYIFRDDLELWCRKGFDYVGAPFLRRDIYDAPVIRQLITVYQYVCRKLHHRTHFDRYGRVGNGGFSLRRVASHLKALSERPLVVHQYAVTHNRQGLFEEDTFWAMEIPWFKYPTEAEAMLFAYNKYPELSYARTGGQLPFGCHGWTKPDYGRFWKKHKLIPMMK